MNQNRYEQVVMVMDQVTLCVIGGCLLVIIVAVFAMYRHQCMLRDRAQLMRDAIRFHDFSFRLPTRRMLFGERALQEALNDMGKEVQKLEAHNEVESWQRLTRVLTHEIMNATAPIQSISQAYLSMPDTKNSPYEEGLRAIYDTSSGLATFVDSYRKMTQLQEPVLTEVDLLAFAHQLSTLYPQLSWTIDIAPWQTMKVDESLFRQIFINLVKNAIEAEAHKMDVRWKDGLQISNDGHIIPDDVRKEIFIPFFTTKRTGSGIGLSLSRQVLMKQGYLLSLAEHAQPGYNVTFVIEKDR